jgi:hypothetical protein
MSKKPYRYEHQEWLELSQRRDWNDPQANPDDLAEYSEFQRPYALPKGEDSYPAWEWSWPDINFPDILPIIVPDPIEDPCSVSEGCEWAKINGPGEIKCGDMASYTQIHVWIGCTVAPWWAAFGSWELESSQEGGKVILHAGLVIARIEVAEDADPETITLTYRGVDNCVDSMSIQITTCDPCFSCEEFTLAGDDTVNQDSTWTGTISPACPTAVCEVSSNSGCDPFTCGINGPGSQVTVDVGPDECGSFTVTVRDGEDCEDTTATKSVRINAGSWVTILTSACTAGCLNTCFPSDGSGPACVTGIYKYGRRGGGINCRDGHHISCHGPPSICWNQDNCDWGCLSPGAGYCPHVPCEGPAYGYLTHHDAAKCEWKCTC